MSRLAKTILKIVAALALVSCLAVLAFIGWWQWGHVTYSDKAEAAACWQQAGTRFPPDLESEQSSIVGPDGVSRPTRSEWDRNATKRNAFADSCIKSCRNRKVFGLSFCW